MSSTPSPTVTLAPTKECPEVGEAETSTLQLLLAVVVLTLMLGMGACTRVQDYIDIMKNPKAPFIGFVCQFGVMPLLALALAEILGVSDVTALSMIMIGCTPGGTTSNLFSYFSNGDVSLSIGMTVVSNIAAFAMMPLLIMGYGGRFMGGCDTDIQLSLLVSGLALTLIPVPIGMFLLRYNEAWGKRCEKVASKVGVYFIIIIIIQQLVVNDAIWDAGWQVWLAAIIMFPIGCGLGYWLSRATQLPKKQCRTVSLETGIQNTTVTIAVISMNFPGNADDVKSAAQQLQNEALAFPLLYSLFLVIGGCCITLGFYHGSRYEEEDDDGSCCIKKKDNAPADGAVKEKDIELVEVGGDQKKKPKAPTKPFSLTEKPDFWTWFNLSSDVFFWIILIDWLWWLASTFWGQGLIAWAMQPRGVLSAFVGDRQDSIRRNNKSLNGLKSTIDGLGVTCHELFQDSFKKHPDAECMGTRKFLGMHKGRKDRFPRKVFGPPEWTTCQETSERALNFGSGLRHLGCQPLSAEMNTSILKSFAPIDGPHCILIFEETCADWMTAVIGAMSQSIVVATSYATLGMGAVAEAINQTNSVAIVCNYKDVDRVTKLKDECPTLQTVIYTRNNVKDDDEDLPEESANGCKVLSFDAVVALGFLAPGGLYPPAAPTPEHLALIMYTSGSTGKPKGVMITHKSIVAAISGIFNYLLEMFDDVSVCVGKSYIAYLPAAHILEFCVECACLALGFKVGYSDTKTITSAGAFHVIPESANPQRGTVEGKKKGTDGGPNGGSFTSLTPPKPHPIFGYLFHGNVKTENGKLVKKVVSHDMQFVEEFGWLNGDKTGFGNFPAGGIQEFGPHMMAAVPKIWDIMKKGVESTLGQLPAEPYSSAQTLIKGAYHIKSRAMQRGCPTPFWDWLLLYKFKNIVGGRQMLFITGGGPINPDCQDVIRTMLGTPLIQGYALTETAAAGTVQPHWSVRNGVVGPPVQSVELKLADCLEVKDHSDLPYLGMDRSHMGMPCQGRGEVWIRGDAVSSGYYVMEEKTKESFDSDGWFHTGDIAIWDQYGQLKIVDRLKNLIKLKGGEYIAIEHMESTYANSVFVNGRNGGLLCYGDGEMDKPVALVQIEPSEIVNWAKLNDPGCNTDDIEALIAQPNVIQAVLDDMNAQGKGKLGANEKLAAVGLISGMGDPDLQPPAANAPWTPENLCLTASNKLNRKPIEKAFAGLLDPLKGMGVNGAKRAPAATAPPAADAGSKLVVKESTNGANI